MLTRVLSRIGSVTTIEAEDGLEGIAQARQHRPDIVFLDGNMPVKGGFETLQDFREDLELRDIPIIVVSGNSEIDNAKQMIEYGVHNYVVKPFNNDTIKRLRKAIESLGFVVVRNEEGQLVS
jgi:CheY-like chemotaxis protein